MKTNQILIRPMGDFTVMQRTSDGMFNATDIIRQWNCISATERKMENFFKLKGTDEFVSTIQERENLHTPKLVYVKSRASRGANSGTWMHPLLFIDFAMWINSEFKYDVLKFVYDQLLAYRNEAGNSYTDMCRKIATVTPEKHLKTVIQATATGINHIVYGDHERNIRNLQAEENLMRELVEMQKKVTMYIEDGVIKDPAGIRKLLRVTWRRKYEPKTLSI